MRADVTSEGLQSCPQVDRIESSLLVPVKPKYANPPKPASATPPRMNEARGTGPRFAGCAWRSSGGTGCQRADGAGTEEGTGSRCGGRGGSRLGGRPRRDRNEHHVEDAVLLALADHVVASRRALRRGLRSGRCARRDRASRRGHARRRPAGLPSSRHGHPGHVVAVRPDRVEDDRRKARVHLGDPARAILANRLGADGARADHEPLVRLAQLAVEAHDLGVLDGPYAGLLVIGGPSVAGARVPPARGRGAQERTRPEVSRRRLRVSEAFGLVVAHAAGVDRVGRRAGGVLAGRRGGGPRRTGAAFGRRARLRRIDSSGLGRDPQGGEEAAVCGRGIAAESAAAADASAGGSCAPWRPARTMKHDPQHCAARRRAKPRRRSACAGAGAFRS